MAQIFISLTPWGFTVITVGFLVIWKENHLYNPVLLSQCQQMVWASLTDHSGWLGAMGSAEPGQAGVSRGLCSTHPAPQAMGFWSKQLLTVEDETKIQGVRTLKTP